MPDQSPKRGARPTPQSVLDTAMHFKAVVGPLIPPIHLMKPTAISSWGNLDHADCVTAEEAFAKACNDPGIDISENEAIAWATKHGVLEGATITDVMTWMQSDGFAGSSTDYDDGPHLFVDWNNGGTLCKAIALGPVKLGVASQQLETAWEANGRKSGWFGTGWTVEAAGEDHCVALCGYGYLSWLAEQFGVELPPGVDGGLPGYAMFTWGTIGIVDVPSMMAITYEAWLRQPTTVTKPIASWKTSDLTKVAISSAGVPGAPLAAGDPAGYGFDSYKTTHVVYRGTDKHIYELYWYDGIWHFDDLTGFADATSAQLADSDPAGYAFDSNNTQHVVYRGTNNHIYELAWNNGWKINDLTTLAHVPAAITATGDPAAYVSDVDKTQHVVFRGADSNIYELQWESGTWKLNDLTKIAINAAGGTGAPLAASDPAGYALGADHTQHVVYRGTGNYIHELDRKNNTWKVSDRTSPTGTTSALPAAGDPAGYGFDADGSQHVAYRSTDNHFHELVNDGHSWQNNDLTHLTGAPTAAGDPAAYGFDADGSQHVAYRGSDNQIHVLSQAANVWSADDLTATGAPDPASNPPSNPAGYVFGHNKSQHVVYRTADKHIHELYLEWPNQ